jgi:hypothetical protein
VNLVPSFLDLLQPFASAMTAPTYASLLTIVAGWAFARRHTVCGGLCGGLAAGVAVPKHHSAYHRVFAAARWSLDAVGLGLLELVLGCGLLAAGGTVFVALDDTLCRHRGRTFWGAGMHYDPLLTGRKWSNAGKAVKSRGHSWVTLGVVLALPFRPGHYFCLPVLFRLCLNKQSAARHRRAYRSRPELGRELLTLMCDRFPLRQFHLLCDSAYGGQDTLRGLPANCQMTARWINNAALYAPAPPRRPGTKGRPPKRGPRLPGSRQMLDGTRCRRVTPDSFGLRGAFRVATCLACLHTVPGRLLRVVAAEPLTRGGRPRPKDRATFYSTVTDATAEQVLCWYATRWAIECTFRDAKQVLGLEQVQGWTAAAAQRSAPTLLLLYGLVVLWFARDGHRHHAPPTRPWYPGKAHASFADMLATLRVRCLAGSFPAAFSDDPPEREDSGNAPPSLAGLLRLVA